MKRMNKKIVASMTLAAIVIAVLVGFMVTQSQLSVAQATTNCEARAQDNLDAAIHIPNTNKVTITNKSSDCTYKVGYASYKVYATQEPENFETQTLVDSKTATLKPKESIQLTVTMPSCAYQVDAFYGDVITSFANGVRYGDRRLTSKIDYTDLCTNETPKAYLTLIKTVINDNGGTRQVSDFTLYIGNTQVTSGQEKQITPGTYTVRENNLSGYTAGNWTGDCSSDGRVTLTNGQHKTCRITNNDNPPVNNDFSGYCVANATSIAIGDSVTFTANANGGNGNFTYSWSGDNVSGTNRTVSTSYNSNGTKYAHVTITSGSQSITRDCSVVVTGSTNSNFSAYCVASNSNTDTYSTVTYTAYPSGGNGNYSYSWSGTDGLNGSNQSTSKSYNYPGTKNAHVIVYSNGQQVTADCSTYIRQDNNNDLGGYCYPSTSSANVNDTITWYASANGGNGNFTYSWTGWDNLYGYSQNISKQYNSPGTKSATVAISSNGQTIYKTCTVVINQYSGSSNSAYCYASPTSVYVGDSVTWSASVNNNYYNNNYYGSNSYSWSGTDGLYGSNQSISRSYNTIGQKTATVNVYTNGQTISATCSVYVNPRTVVYNPPTTGGVYLDQVPYTGIGDNMKVSFFILGLIAWSAVVSYYLIRRKARKAGMSVGQFLGTTQISFMSANATPRMPITQLVAPAVAATTLNDRISTLKTRLQKSLPIVSQAPVANIKAIPVESTMTIPNLPTDSSYEIFFGTQNAVMETAPSHAEDVASTIEAKARELETIISADALETIVATSKNNKHNALIILTHLVEIYKGDAKTDKWLVLNGDKVNSILFANESVMTPSFVEWLATGNESKVLSFLRMFQMQGQSVKKFIGNVVIELDSTYQSRVNNDPVLNSSVAGAASAWSNEQLAEVIETLVHAVDENFSSTYASIKIAVLKVLSLVK